MAGPGVSLPLSCSCACQCSCSLSGTLVLSQRLAGATGMAGSSKLRCCPMHAWGVLSQAAAGTRKVDSWPVEEPLCSPI